MQRRSSALAVACALAAGACAREGMLAPRGDDAEAVARLTWLMVGLAVPIWLLVVALLVASLRSKARRPRDGTLLVGGGLVLPAIVLSALLAVGVRTLLAAPAGEDLRIEVIAHQFWWELRYPDFETANELRIPVDHDVRLVLSSDDVIHSFWVPQLAGKRDVIPGRVNQLVVRAHTPAVYRGQCAEFCGIQHANMALVVVAQTPSEYAAWAAAASAGAPVPRTPSERAGYETFLASGCAACHAIRGTPARGDVGPDLTLFAQRRTIGAGAAPNTRGHLGAWVVDSQTIKPGNHMPPMEVEADRLLDLLAFLESLR